MQQIVVNRVCQSEKVMLIIFPMYGRGAIKLPGCIPCKLYAEDRPILCANQIETLMLYLDFVFGF
jgi:hypothetical protein